MTRTATAVKGTIGAVVDAASELVSFFARPSLLHGATGVPIRQTSGQPHS